MRLLFVSNLFPDQQEPYRGLDNATLLHILRAQMEVRVLAIRPSLPWHRRGWKARPADAPLRPRFLPTLYIPKIGHRWNHLLYARALRPVITGWEREGPFDAVLASWLFPDACAVARVVKDLPLRLVTIAQGSDAHHYLRIPPRRKIITTELRRASAIVTRSAKLAQLLEDAGLPRERLHPVYNGVDLSTFHPGSVADRAAVRDKWGISPSDPVILFVGNFLPVKNPNLLIQAHAKLVRLPAMPRARLVLVGGGALEPEMRQQIAAAGTSAQVIFAGRQEPQGVAEMMRGADVLALSSWNEGVPNVVLEAFASGLPVVATDVGGISEVLSSPQFGTLVPAGDDAAFARALESTLARQFETQTIAAHGRTFNWAATADAYSRLLSGP
jgi:teichuronic acid biosynthesis glycosyltransferase TuaC